MERYTPLVVNSSFGYILHRCYVFVICVFSILHIPHYNLQNMYIGKTTKNNLSQQRCCVDYDRKTDCTHTHTHTHTHESIYPADHIKSLILFIPVTMLTCGLHTYHVHLSRLERHPQC